MKASLSRPAAREFVEAARTIATDSRRAARGFTKAVDDALAKIGRYPEIGTSRLDLAPAPIRFWSLPRYRYVMVYDAAAKPPRILRILHTARDIPGALGERQLD